MKALREALRALSSDAGDIRVLLGALAVIVLASAGSLGEGAWPFKPPVVDPQGLFAPLVRAAGLDWNPGVLRSAAMVAALLVALTAVGCSVRGARTRVWVAIVLTALVAGLMTVPGVALQTGLRQSSAPWFHTNDSTYQIELAGQLVRDGTSPYGHDYRYSGMERFYTRDGTESQRVRDRQVALRHFAYFPGTPLSAAAWGLLPQPFSDYRVLVLLCTLALGATALLFRGPLAWRLALGAVIALNPVAIKSAWFGQADAPALLFTILAFALAVRSRWAWTAVLIAIAILLKQFALFALPFLAVMAWRRDGRDALLRPALAGAAILLVGFLPFLIADAGAVWEDTIAYGGSIYRIIGYGLAPLLLEAGILGDRFGSYPFWIYGLIVWLPATAILARAVWRTDAAWLAAAGFGVSLYILFFGSRVFQETYVLWPIVAVALGGLLAIHERGETTEAGADPLRGSRAGAPAADVA